MRKQKWSQTYYQRHKSKILEYSKERYSLVRDDPEYKAQRSARQHKRFYAEPIENKIRRLESQDYKCANSNCQKPINLSSGHQDHNHTTKKMRGVLCQKCNQALGLLNDEVGQILGLADYLTSFP